MSELLVSLPAWMSALQAELQETVLPLTLTSYELSKHCEATMSVEQLACLHPPEGWIVIGIEKPSTSETS